MTYSLNVNFIRQRIPQSCRSLLDIFMTNERQGQLAAADGWLLEATASHFGQNGFMWGELLTDLAHCYPLIADDSLTV